MPGYSVIYDGKNSTIKPGHLNGSRPGTYLEHFDTWVDARKALSDYFAKERDEWAKLSRFWRRRTAQQLWAGQIPKRVRERRGIGS